MKKELKEILIYVGIGLVLMFIITRLIKKFIADFKAGGGVLGATGGNALQQVNKLVDNVNKSADKINEDLITKVNTELAKKPPAKPSYTGTEYVNQAKKLWVNLDVDNKMSLDKLLPYIVWMKNYNDYLLLFKAFGIKMFSFTKTGFTLDVAIFACTTDIARASWKKHIDTLKKVSGI